MFTGIVEQQGKVTKKTRLSDSLQLALDIGPLVDEVKLGDSISVNGVCLTVNNKSAAIVSFDLVPETVKRTNLGDLKIGNEVNIERAIRAGESMGGHFVQGHIEGTATIKVIDKHGRFANMKFAASVERLTWRCIWIQMANYWILT